MSNYIIPGETLTDIADQLRLELDTTQTFPPEDMPLAIHLAATQGGGGGKHATGTVTGATNTTIVHNLGSQKIMGIVYPAGDYVASANGKAIIKFFCNADAIIGAPILCDFSRYNTSIANPYTYTPEKSWNLRMGGPSSTGTTIANARGTASTGAIDTYTDNAVNLLDLSVGQEYHYHIFAVD